MPSELSRRGLIVGAAGALSASAIPFPNVILNAAVKPVVISSANGQQFRNGGKETCVERAFRLLTEGRDPLDAVVAGVEINELDPLDDSVGYGGIPNAEGIVQLDASVMHGPRKWAGSVAALEGIRTPAKIAKLVAETTDHHLIVGAGAQAFARSMGFEIEADLNTDNSRRQWLEWKRRVDPEHYLDPKKRDGASLEAALSMAQDGLLREEHLFGTIHCSAITAKGEIAATTTTSGLSFKIPGRVGDSPILGAGLYVDNAVGAAGSTGRGEANLYGLSSFLIVEQLRLGKHPKDAGLEAMRRVVANTREKRLLNSSGRPAFNLRFYILDAQGRHAGVCLSGRGTYAVCDEKGGREEACVSLL